MGFSAWLLDWKGADGHSDDNVNVGIADLEGGYLIFKWIERVGIADLEGGYLIFMVD